MRDGDHDAVSAYHRNAAPQLGAAVESLGLQQLHETLLLGGRAIVHEQLILRNTEPALMSSRKGSARGVGHAGRGNEARRERTSREGPGARE